MFINISVFETRQEREEDFNVVIKPFVPQRHT